MVAVLVTFLHRMRTRRSAEFHPWLYWAEWRAHVTTLGECLEVIHNMGLLVVPDPLPDPRHTIFSV